MKKLLGYATAGVSTILLLGSTITAMASGKSQVRQESQVNGVSESLKIVFGYDSQCKEGDVECCRKHPDDKACK